MKTLRHVIFWLLPALSSTPLHAEAMLSVSASTPTAKVSPRSRERAPLNLPDLEYQFSIDAVCHGGMSPASLSLAVADTRRSFNAEQITGGELDQVRLLVPAAQIAPVVVQNFCVAEGDSGSLESAASPLTVPAALSVQASLLCLDETDQSMKYASASLDVMLLCDSNGEAADRTDVSRPFTEL